MDENKIDFMPSGSVDKMASTLKNIIRLIVLIILVVIVGWLFLRSRSTAFTLAMDSIPDNLEIPTVVTELQLQRGELQFFLQKKEVLVTRPYFVVDTNIFWKWQVGQKDPVNIYSASYELLPYDEQYKRALELEKKLAGEANLQAAAETAASQRETEQLDVFIQKVQMEKISVAILPATDRIRVESKKIKPGDVVKISGIYFEHKRATKNGVVEPLSQCLENVGLFYTTTLYREK